MFRGSSYSKTDSADLAVAKAIALGVVLIVAVVFSCLCVGAYVAFHG
jgi:hypothetical protein